MYKCKIYRDIFPCDPSQVDKIPAPVLFRIECNLSFSPFIGLEIINGGVECTIKRVKWDLHDEIFYCHADTDFPDIPNDEQGFKDLVIWALDDGWNVTSWPKAYIDLLGEKPHKIK